LTQVAPLTIYTAPKVEAAVYRAASGVLVYSGSLISKQSTLFVPLIPGFSANCRIPSSSLLA